MSSFMDYACLSEVERYAEEHIRLSAAQAKDYPAHIGPEYRWKQTLRVTQFGIQIAKAEGANVEWVTVACLLHDSEWYYDLRNKDFDHGHAAARAIRPFLEQIRFSPEAVDNICEQHQECGRQEAARQVVENFPKIDDG